MFRIYPYKLGSNSVKKLKEKLGALSIKLENSKYVPRSTHIIINWGNSSVPSWYTDSVTILNHPDAVAVASDKLETFKILEGEGIPHVPFTTDKGVAKVWLNGGNKVFARTKLKGHSGEGIEVVDGTESEHDLDVIHASSVIRNLGHYQSADALLELRQDLERELPDAPLYTKGVKNHGEYRVHVFDDDVILYQKKSRRVDEDGNIVTADGEEADVRNLGTNWIYRTGNLRRLERIENLAIDTVVALGLDFGAVDIIMDESGDVFVLEVNSAPGLGNTDTLDAYANAFIDFKHVIDEVFELSS